MVDQNIQNVKTVRTYYTHQNILIEIKNQTMSAKEVKMELPPVVKEQLGKLRTKLDQVPILCQAEVCLRWSVIHLL